MEDKGSEEREENSEIPEQLSEEQPVLEEVVEKEGEDNVENEDQGSTGGSPPDQDIHTIAVPSMNEVADLSATIEKVSVCRLVKIMSIWLSAGTGGWRCCRCI